MQYDSSLNFSDSISAMFCSYSLLLSILAAKTPNNKVTGVKISYFIKIFIVSRVRYNYKILAFPIAFLKALFSKLHL